MASANEGPIADAIAEMRSQVLDLQSQGDAASTALAADLTALIAKHEGTGAAERPAAPVEVHVDPVAVIDAGVIDIPRPVFDRRMDEVARLDDGYDGYDGFDGEFAPPPPPNRLVVAYAKHNPADGPLTETEIQAVLADAQAALEIMEIGTVVVVDTTPDLDNPLATVVSYEVLEPGTVPLSAIPLGVGAGVVAGVGRVSARTSVAYVEPAFGV